MSSAGIERQRRAQSRLIGVDPREFLIGAVGIIAQALHLPAGLRPGLLQLGAGCLEQQLFALADADQPVAAWLAERMAAGAKTQLVQSIQHRGQISGGNLQDGAELFGEQGRDRITPSASWCLLRAAIDVSSRSRCLAPFG